MSSVDSRVLPTAEVHHQDHEGAFSASVRTVTPVDGEISGSLVFVPGHLAGGDSAAHIVDEVIEETLSTPYGVNVWTFDTRYTPYGRSIGHRISQTVAVLRNIRNQGDGKTAVVCHSEGNHVTFGSLLSQPDLLRDVGGVVGLGMVSVNRFPGTEHQATSIEDLATPRDGNKPAIGVPMLGFARALVEEAVDHLPGVIRESNTATLVNRVVAAAGRLGLNNVVPAGTQGERVPLLSLASAGVSEVIEIVPYAAVNSDARQALITLLSNVAKSLVGNDPFGEGHQILTTPSAELSALLAGLVPVTHIAGRRDRLAGGSIREGLMAAGFTGDVHEYDVGHLELLFRRPVVRRVAHTAMQYMFGARPELRPADQDEFDLTASDRGARFIVGAGMRSVRQRLGIAA